MPVIDSILSLATDTLTISRRAGGSFDSDGVWQPAEGTLFTLTACVQPATGLQRVVGGRDMRSDEQGQRVADVRVIYTETNLKTREEGFEPDQIIGFEGGTWTCTRQEKWVGPDGPDDVYYRVLVTRETFGAS